MNIKYQYGLYILGLMLLAGCSDKEKTFRLVPSSESGITFRNTLKETPEFNIFNYMYFYNGAGVAAGDLNGDNLPDVYFTANQAQNKLYLNKGAFKFADVTEQSGATGFDGWATGVTMADVNSDGRLDIYVSYVGDYLIYKGRNQLFINEGNDQNGVLQFKDRAMEFGLDLVGFSTHATFFDYDRDGDLDMFMLNHSLHQQGTFGNSKLRETPHALAGDKLMRNDNGHFVDVTQGSGIYSSVLGYGLGVVVSDVNLDGWPDIYVGNDFHENDYLYINQGNGTFVEMLEKSMNHTSRYTMGVDFADFNNDAFPDLIGMDMLPDDPKILKASQAEETFDVYTFKLHFGYNHQFARNVLQLNNRDGTYSEIALQAGVSATDWSWATLFADFNLDGRKDILVANGIMRRSNDLDYINFITVDSIQHRLGEEVTENDLQYITRMPQIKIPNYLYINNGDSTFTDKAKEWGLDQPSYSNGAAYADFDNDGDLDIVMNNIEDEAFLYENKTLGGKNKAVDKHYLQVVLKGKTGNAFGLGAKVFLYDSGQLQMQECMATRGFQSSVDYRLLFGTGAGPLDSVVVVWNDGSFQKLGDVKTDQALTLDQQQASGTFSYAQFHAASPFFRKAPEVIVPFTHRENKFVEFNREQLIPHMVSSEGPGSATADINGDGREDIFIGGGKWQAAGIFIQTSTGTFTRLAQPVLEADSTYEDVDAAFFDADNDRDADLVVVSGGNEFSGKSPYRNSRIYINDGKGNFTKSGALTDIFTTGSCVSVADFDNDGDQDLFLGSRAIPWRYGMKPDSYLLTNDGKGNFTNATEKQAPVLKQFGFVKHASWTDVDGDKDLDLAIAAEWSPITILVNTNNNFAPLPLKGSGLENTNGWWNVIEPVDIDQDGDMDFVAGNLGLNSKLRASQKEPVKMYVADLDKNDSTDQVLTHFMHGKEYPFYTRDEMTRQMPYLKKRYLSYHKFAEATFSDMFSKDQLENAQRYEAYTFSTAIIINLGNGKFEVRPLPAPAQFSAVQAVAAGDFDGDRTVDLLLAGNFYPVNVQRGRYDASYGLVLKGDGKGNFTACLPGTSGFSVTGEVRRLKKIAMGDKTYYLAVRNNDTVEAFTLK